jgi:hypothetical protein
VQNAYLEQSPHLRVAQGRGLTQALSSLILTVGLIIFSIDLTRARVIPAWAAFVLPLGALNTFFLSPASLLPSVTWIVLGAVLWPRRGRPAERLSRVR